MTKIQIQDDTHFYYFFHCRSEGSGHDTVGAIALDQNGNVAFATSTGGITAKQPGRVGDSPIVGTLNCYRPHT